MLYYLQCKAEKERKRKKNTLHLSHKSAELTLEYEYQSLILSWEPSRPPPTSRLFLSLSHTQLQATLSLSLDQATTWRATTTSTNQLVLHPSHFPTFLTGSTSSSWNAYILLMVLGEALPLCSVLQLMEASA
jgi:hypothetical protein